MDGLAPPQVRLEMLELLVGHALDPGLVARTRQAVDRQSIAAAAAAYFLLGLDGDGGVGRFVCHTLERLVQQLIRSTEQRRVDYRGQVRGRVLWAATYKQRYTDDCDPTCFVCREVYKRYDTPENQLLKYVVEAIADCLKAVPDELREGICYLPQGAQGRLWPAKAGVPSVSTAATLSEMETTLHRLRRNVLLREIETPARITEQHLLRAQTARLEEYQRVAEIYERYRTTVPVPSWEGLVAAQGGVLLLPARPGERWIELTAAVWQTAVLRASH